MPTEPCFEINPLVSCYQIGLQHSLQIFFTLPKASEEPAQSYEAKRKSTAHNLFIENEAKQCDKGQMRAYNDKLLFVPDCVVFMCNFLLYGVPEKLNHWTPALFWVERNTWGLLSCLQYAHLWVLLTERFCLQEFLQGPGLLLQVPAEVMAAGCPRNIPCVTFEVTFCLRWAQLMSLRCLVQWDKDLPALTLWYLKVWK